ncbi:MAG: hypothetical protein BWY56_02391 [Acidobacteria bacterium ADurb.Bin340]|nr:MAG: hypothetical protein BWY56_02391 [Acidobacteria bacterium ADurb.Bin340]
MIPIPSPGMEPPRPSGCPSCAAAEAQCDRMAQQIRQLESALALEARARVAAAEMAHEAKLALDEALGSIQSLEARLEAEARTTRSLLSYLADLRFALGDDGRRMQDELLDYCRELRRNKDAIQAALGNGADEDAWRPGEHWADAAARKIRAARGAQCTR